MTLILLSLLACGPKDVPEDTAVVDTGTTVIPTGDPDLVCQVDVRCEGNILDDPKVPCSMQVVSGDGVPLYDGPAGMELRGRTSLALPKPQYSVDLRKYGELPVWPGFVWHYVDDGTNLGTAWRAPAYDDTAWSQGAAPLGYGEDYLATTISSGSDPAAPTITSYFRYTFSVASLADITKLSVGLIRNDGAAVYLNGTEILRDNLPADASYDTPALAPLSAADEVLWVTVDVDPALLVDGPNVLAVELHQSDAGLQAAYAAPDTGPSDTGGTDTGSGDTAGTDTGDTAGTDTGDTGEPVDEPGRARFDLFLSASGGDSAVDLLGMGSDSDWILNGQHLDRVLFRNRLAYDLFQSFGGPERYATQSVFCELTLDGNYQGVYTLGERIEREGTRVDIDKGDNSGTSFIVKLDDVDGFHDNGVGYGTWQMVFPDATSETEAEVSGYLADWEAAIQGSDPTDPETGVFGYVDMDSAVDFVLLQEFSKNIDAYQLSVYLWKNTDGKMFFAPWDLDLSFGYPFYDCGAEGWVTRAEFVDAMAADPAFHAALVARWAELRAGPMGEDAILARIAGYDTTLGDAVARNTARWPIEDIVYQTDDVADWLCPVSSYEEEHTRVLSFISARLVWMDANIASF
ncbi:MAG: CotH kinase family protein [Pseudomonadota bacterium]|nr:CotH kinase family protein [Pseudomonadota bacterium]